jgi:hypothetical protein
MGGEEAGLRGAGLFLLSEASFRKREAINAFLMKRL